MPSRFDICVLGGGLAGSAFAILIARRGARVALIEKTRFDRLRAGEHLPDVILMDIRLPDMDGTDALLRLKEREPTASIPVVALTSFAMKGDRERLLAAGFDGYLEKPISVREFPDQVRSYCRRDEA